jgi:hypothetical protein
MQTMELRSSRELLAWLVETGTTRPGSGAFKRGEYLLSLAISEGKLPHRQPNLLSGWLYELRDRDLIVFDDSDAVAIRSPDGGVSRKDVHLIRDIAVTAAGRRSSKSPRPR